MTTAIRIRMLRRARGWSQAELARRAALSRRTVMRLEQGWPGSSATIRCVAIALGVTDDALVGEAA